MATAIDLDILALNAKALEFDRRLRRVKEANPLPDSDWYPYPSLSCFSLLNNLLTGDHRQLLTLTRGLPILDLGCGDGDVSIFLNSLGLSVDAIDHSEINCNRMEGVYALTRLLQSSVDIYAVDLDSQFGLPQRYYGLTFFLGVLYHLRNPVYVLERLAERSHYCLLSTRIAASSPGRQGNLKDIPVAYLLDEGEANADSTNYWIFSEPGLKRLLRRTGWKICDYMTTGDPNKSDPTHNDADQRAFCLLRSIWAQPLNMALGRGWHELEYGAYRWTERVFAVDLARPASGGRTLTLRFHLPPVLMHQVVGPISLHAIVSGVSLPSRAYSTPNAHTYQCELPDDYGQSCHVEFVLDKVMPPRETDPRELGILVNFPTEDDGHYQPITIS